MSSGIGFFDVLVSEVTMVVGVLVFFLCGALLIFKRRTLGSSQKGIAVTALLITGIYLAFIIWAVIMWGR